MLLTRDWRTTTIAIVAAYAIVVQALLLATSGAFHAASSSTDPLRRHDAAGRACGGGNGQGVRCDRQAPSPRPGARRSTCRQVPCSRRQARPALPRRGLHLRPDGAARAIHRGRAWRRRRPVHAASLRRSRRERTTTDRGTDPLCAGSPQGSGRPAWESLECQPCRGARPGDSALRSGDVALASQPGPPATSIPNHGAGLPLAK